MFDDDSAYVGALPLFSTFKSLQKPSSSYPVYDFSLSSSSLEHVDEEIQIDVKVQATQGNEIEKILLKEIKPRQIPLLLNHVKTKVVMMIILRVPPRTPAPRMRTSSIRFPS